MKSPRSVVVPLLLVLLNSAESAHAAFTGSGAMSDSTPEPGQVVSVTWQFTEDDNTLPDAQVCIESPSGGDIFDGSTLPPIGAPLYSVKPPISNPGPPPCPPEMVFAPFPGQTSFVETGIVIPADIEPGVYAYGRDWFGPGLSGNINSGNGAFAVFTIDEAPSAEVIQRILGNAVPGRIDPQGSGALRVTWTITLDPTLAAPIDIRSLQGELDDRPFTGPLVINNAIGTVVLNENLLITPELIERALSRGRQTLSYSRSFETGTGSPQRVTASVEIALDATLLQSVSGVPSIPFLDAAVGRTVSINWLAATRNLGRGAPTRIVSPGGDLRLSSGRRVGSVGDTLEQTVSGGVAVFTETLSITRDALVRALRDRSDRLVYRRTFGDGVTTLTEQVEFQVISAGSSGELFVPFVELSFEDGTVRKQVSNGESLRAVAEITSTGFGRLEGVWEVALPPFSLTNPVFSPLSLVQDNLAGSRVHRIVSPDLPTTERGTGLVRFRIVSPSLERDTPGILYLVSDNRPVANVVALSPRIGSMFEPGLAFRWQTVPFAASYLLELIEYPRGPLDGFVSPIDNVCDDLTLEEQRAQPVGGMFVDSASSTAVLTSLAHSLIEQKRARSTLCWRVVALDNRGMRMAEGDFRTLFAPGSRSTSLDPASFANTIFMPPVMLSGAPADPTEFVDISPSDTESLVDAGVRTQGVSASAVFPVGARIQLDPLILNAPPGAVSRIVDQSGQPNLSETDRVNPNLMPETITPTTASIRRGGIIQMNPVELVDTTAALSDELIAGRTQGPTGVADFDASLAPEQSAEETAAFPRGNFIRVDPLLLAAQPRDGSPSTRRLPQSQMLKVDEARVAEDLGNTFPSATIGESTTVPAIRMDPMFLAGRRAAPSAMVEIPKNDTQLGSAMLDADLLDASTPAAETTSRAANLLRMDPVFLVGTSIDPAALADGLDDSNRPDTTQGNAIATSSAASVPGSLRVRGNTIRMDPVLLSAPRNASSSIERSSDRGSAEIAGANSRQAPQHGVLKDAAVPVTTILRMGTLYLRGSSESARPESGFFFPTRGSGK